MIDKWDIRFSDMAKLVATWSKDPSTGVGCVITNKKNRVLSVGFNGFPRIVADEQSLLLDRSEKLRRTIHAEVNALLFARGPVEGCTAYVTHPPCSQCAAKLIQAGIDRVVYPIPDPAFAERWKEDSHSAMSMFCEAGVQVDCVPPR